MKVAAF